jgi:hypothetical protein
MYTLIVAAGFSPGPSPEWELCLSAGVLVANKSDMTNRRVVSNAEGEKLASSLSLDFFECSVVSLLHTGSW